MHMEHSSCGFKMTGWTLLTQVGLALGFLMQIPICGLLVRVYLHHVPRAPLAQVSSVLYNATPIEMPTLPGPVAASSHYSIPQALLKLPALAAGRRTQQNSTCSTSGFVHADPAKIKQKGEAVCKSSDWWKEHGVHPWEAKGKRGKGTLETGHEDKYTDWEWNINRFLKLASLLRLDKGPACRALDVGSGPGWLVWTLRELGHSADALQPYELNSDLKNKMTAILGVTPTDHAVMAHKHMPPPKTPECKYDVIVSSCICFDKSCGDDKDKWGKSEWQFWLRDVASNFLKEKGRIMLQLNKHADDRVFTSDKSGLHVVKRYDKWYEISNLEALV